MILELPLFSLGWKSGSDTYHFQDTWYRSESCRRRLRRTAPCGPPGTATQVRPAYRQRYLCFSIACRSTWQLSSAPSPAVQSEFHDRDANRICILELRTNQCFVCISFVCLGANAELRQSCHAWNFCDMLTLIQVVRDSNC